MLASCMKPRKVDVSLFHLRANLLNPPVSHAKNLSAALSCACKLLSRACMVSPCFGLCLFLWLTSMFAFIPLLLRYSLIPFVSYAEPASFPLGLADLLSIAIRIQAVPLTFLSFKNLLTLKMNLLSRPLNSLMHLHMST